MMKQKDAIIIRRTCIICSKLFTFFMCALTVVTPFVTLFRVRKIIIYRISLFTGNNVFLTFVLVYFLGFTR